MSSPADIAYSAVAKLYPNQIFEPTSIGYADALGSFWNARQQDSRPRSIFQPKTVEQVQRALVEVVQANCPFAIKGGGHSGNARGSSIDDGFLFDLVNLDHIEVSDDRKTAKLGPGLRWIAVYDYLAQLNLTAVGGRDSTVGVPGFVFGGGLSNYATQKGWGLDNLVGAEIVLANGKVITADSDHHSDLFTALLGGGAHNFGIVTSLAVKVYPYSGLWGGFAWYAPERIDEVFAAYDAFTKNLATEGKAHTILHFEVADRKILPGQYLVHPDPVADPLIFDHFRRIPHEEYTTSVTSATELATKTHDLTYVTGRRSTYWNWTYEYDIELLQTLITTYVQAVNTLKPDCKIVIEINHITPQQRVGATRAGQRNVLGLDNSDKMLMNLLLAAVWDNKEDDEQVETTMEAMGREFQEIAKAKGKRNDFIYMNYANARQAVIPSFGKENQAFLQEVSAKYDPEGVFQNLNLAGFKLDPKFEQSP